MAEPFLGEIRIVSFDFAPKGWALANGQLLSVPQNQALFSLFGTTYGGDGRTTFAIPDLRGRASMHVGNGHSLGEKGGEQTHTLSIAELPTHLHLLQGTTANADLPAPAGNYFGTVSNVYGGPQNFTALHPQTIGNTGGSQAHNNMQPYLVLTFVVALQGIFPSRTEG
jgi:microcystin-dependent protein